MQRRCLGQSDIEVSVIGLGTVKFGRNQGVKYPTTFQLPSDRDLENLIDQAYDLGINLLDTAPAYGISEERIGKLLQGKRQHWVISTKVGEEFIDGVSQFNFSEQALLLSVERSLRRLQTDYLDILLVHSNGDDVRLIEEEQVFKTLAILKKSGKIRAYGMSTKTVAGGLLTVKYADVVMVTFNLAQQAEREVIVQANHQQKGVLVKKALASGHLQHLKFTSRCLPRDKAMGESHLISNNPVVDSLHFVLAEPGVSSVIIGTINIEHLRECANLGKLAIVNA